MSNATDIDSFISDLDGGVLKEKLAHILSEVALGTVLHGGRAIKGKVNLELTLQPIGEHSQVIISHKLSHSTPTQRGKKMEENTTETPMFVAKGGRLSIDQPKEEHDGQFTLVHQLDGPRKQK